MIIESYLLSLENLGKMCCLSSSQIDDTILFNHELILVLLFSLFSPFWSYAFPLKNRKLFIYIYINIYVFLLLGRHLTPIVNSITNRCGSK